MAHRNRPGSERLGEVFFFVAVAAIAVVVVGGWMILVSTFDTTPSEFPDRAPWSQRASTPERVAQQQVAPRSPATPCGEPGNEYPLPTGSPCQPKPGQLESTSSSGGK